MELKHPEILEYGEKNYTNDDIGEESNCFGATLYILGQVEDLTNLPPDYMFFEEIFEETEELEVGDVVALIDASEGFEILKHIAVYIGRGQFFEKTGISGEFRISNMRQICEQWEYKGCNTSFWTLKKEE